jgi:hypothetical protein
MSMYPKKSKLMRILWKVITAMMGKLRGSFGALFLLIYIRPIAVTLPTAVEPEFTIMMDAAKEIGVII